MLLCLVFEALHYIQSKVPTLSSGEPHSHSNGEVGATVGGRGGGPDGGGKNYSGQIFCPTGEHVKDSAQIE